jgi:hypothetical protein
VATWQRAGKALAQRRRRDLTVLTDERALQDSCMLLEAMDQLPRLPSRTASGLVEQQRLFTRLRSS